MSIAFSCECGKQMQARDEYSGRRTKCPACGAVLVIPTSQPEQDAEAAYDLEAPAPAASFVDFKVSPGDAAGSAPKFVTINGASAPPLPPSLMFLEHTKEPEFAPLRLTAGLSEREPACYGFLAKYAGSIRNVGIILTGCLLIVTIFGYMGSFVSIYLYDYPFRPSADRAYKLILLTIGLVVTVLAILVIVLVPILFAVSLIQLAVDSGRNLRAIRAELEARRPGKG